MTDKAADLKAWRSCSGGGAGRLVGDEGRDLFRLLIESIPGVMSVKFLKLVIDQEV